MGKIDAIKEKLGFRRPDRTREAFKRMSQDAGFIPIFNVDDVEQRRQEIKSIMEDVEEMLFDNSVDMEKRRTICQKVYRLFFTSGNAWYRGLDDRELPRSSVSPASVRS